MPGLTRRAAARWRARWSRRPSCSTTSGWASAERRALTGLDDSKRKTIEQREELLPKVLAVAARVNVAVRCVRGIDSRGLHNTNLEALASCLERVHEPGAACLVDGFALPLCRVEHSAVIDGDARSAAIAAASIVAKVTRDRYMHRAADVYPGWNFDGNAGYSTQDHREAIAAQGISPLHRRSFDSVAYTQLKI